MPTSTIGRKDRTDGRGAFSLLRSGLGGRLAVATGMIAGIALMLLVV